MEQVGLCAVWHMKNWLGSSLNKIQGWTTVRESYSRALEQGPLLIPLFLPLFHPLKSITYVFEAAAKMEPIVTETSGIHALLRHLVLLGLAQSKPSGPAQACTGQAQAELNGATVRVYPAPNARSDSDNAVPFSLYIINERGVPFSTPSKK